jgi:hypothetical protein
MPGSCGTVGMSGVRNTSSLNPIPPFGLSIPRQGSERRGLPLSSMWWKLSSLTRILYADLGLTDHQQSSLIARFVERFQGQEIDAYRVIQGKAFYP